MIISLKRGELKLNKGPKRILHIVSAMERGGAETLIMNIYRNIDRSKLQFDFVTHSPQKGDYEAEIAELGGKIYKVSSLGQLGPYSYVKELKKIMANYPYEAVHAHTDYQSGFPALAAKLAGIRNRICHSHSTNWPKGNTGLHKISLDILRSIIKYSATNYCSCSIEAANFLFGEKAAQTGKVSILKNGINITEFTNLQINNRESVLKELNLSEDTKLLGHVGKFSDSKNQIFILKILKKLIENNKNFVALLVGDGPLKDRIEEEAEKLGVQNHVRFLGVRRDIPRLMNAFDVFIFPSKFEGFGIVAIEAQCSGTPCVLSDTIPEITDIGLGLTSFLSLNDPLDCWCEQINSALQLKSPSKDLIINIMSKKGFNIESNVRDWLELYGVG